MPELVPLIDIKIDSCQLIGNRSELKYFIDYSNDKIRNAYFDK